MNVITSPITSKFECTGWVEMAEKPVVLYFRLLKGKTEVCTNLVLNIVISTHFIHKRKIKRRNSEKPEQNSTLNKPLVTAARNIFP